MHKSLLSNVIEATEGTGAGGRYKLAPLSPTFPPGLTKVGICINKNLVIVLGKFSPPSNSQLCSTAPTPRQGEPPYTWATQRKASPAPCSGAAFPVPQPQPTEQVPWLPAASTGQTQGQAKTPAGARPGVNKWLGLRLLAHPLQLRTVETQVSSRPSGLLNLPHHPQISSWTFSWLKLGGGTND